MNVLGKAGQRRGLTALTGRWEGPVLRGLDQLKGTCLGDFPDWKRHRKSVETLADLQRGRETCKLECLTFVD